MAVVGNVVLKDIPGVTGSIFKLFYRLKKIARLEFTFGTFLFTTVSIMSFVAVAVTPLWLSGENTWISREDMYVVLLASWPAILGGLWLEYGDKIRSSAAVKKTLNERWSTVHSGLANVIATVEAPPDRSVARDKASEIHLVRKNALIVAAECVKLELGLSDKEVVSAVLCDTFGKYFDQNSRDYFYVTARSDSVEHDYRHRKDKMVAGHALEIKDIAHSNRMWKYEGPEIPDDKRERDFKQPKPKWGVWPRLSKRNYQSVVAVRIRRGEQEFGALCIDCNAPYVFSGKIPMVRKVLAPYAAALARTYPIDVSLDNRAGVVDAD